MTSWQAAQTTRVLRRLVAMSVAHAGWPGPAGPEAGELADLVHQHLARFAAQLAPPGQEPVDQLLAGVGGRFGDTVERGPRPCRVPGGSRRTGLPGPACRCGGSWPRSRSVARTGSRSWPCAWWPSSTRWTGAWRPGSSASTSRRASAGRPGARRRWRAGSSRRCPGIRPRTWRRCRSRPGSAGPTGARVCRGAGRGHIWP